MPEKIASLNHRRLVSLLLLGALLTLAPLSQHAVLADPAAPTQEDRHVTLAVASLLRDGHLSEHALDDEISQRCYKSFLKSLDPSKLYFYQRDIDAFSEDENRLDDMIKRGDVSFAYKVFEVFLRRVDERVALVDQLLAMDHDFTVDEEVVIDPEAASYPRDEEEAREAWRKRIKYDLLVQKADAIDRAKKAEGGNGEAPEDWLEEARERLTKRYHSFANRMHQTDRNELLEMYLTAMTTAFDPHTSYMSRDTLENFEISMRLKLEGIGAALQSKDGETVVNNIIPGGAADRDGRLKAEDRIIGVGQGKDGEIVDVQNMKLSDVVSKIRGPRGTIVRLEVKTLDGSIAIYDITRDEIELKDSEARSVVFEEGRKPNGDPYKIGVIDLPSFYMDMDGARRRLPDYKSTTRDVRRILDEFKEQGVDAVLMDLRRNGGGSLNEAISLTGLFIDEGPVVQVKGADGEVQSYDDLERGTACDGPLVVLVSKFSASASEIFAGAIQDYRRGLVIGDKATHGKGTVQTLRELGRELFLGPNPPPLGALKITMQKFYRPSGDSTQNRGVVSDIELPSLTTHLPVSESDLDYAMEFDRVDPAQYKRVNYVDQAMIEQLTKLSEQRCEACTDFAKERQRIKRYEERKNRTTMTLHEEKFFAYRAELDADREEEKQLEQLEENNREVFKRDFYGREALAITVDYLQHLVKLAAN